MWFTFYGFGFLGSARDSSVDVWGFRGCIGIMENKMETNVVWFCGGLGTRINLSSWSCLLPRHDSSIIPAC